MVSRQMQLFSFDIARQIFILHILAIFFKLSILKLNVFSVEIYIYQYKVQSSLEQNIHLSCEKEKSYAFKRLFCPFFFFRVSIVHLFFFYGKNKYFNRIKFREIKFREVKNSRNAAYKLSRIGAFSKFREINFRE